MFTKVNQPSQPPPILNNMYSQPKAPSPKKKLKKKRKVHLIGASTVPNKLRPPNMISSFQSDQKDSSGVQLPNDRYGNNQWPKKIELIRNRSYPVKQLEKMERNKS